MSEQRRFLLYLSVAVAAVLAYQAWAAALYRPGFPLDDAWIHQVYARSLAQDGRWSFQAGEASAGSTAPLWTALLVPGQVLGWPPVIWSALLGVLGLAALGMAANAGLRRLAPSRPGWALWAGLFVVLEWHLVWASVSGMETLWFAAAVLLVLVRLLDPGASNFRTGLLIGLAVWLRPDALSLLGPAAMVALTRPGGPRVGVSEFLKVLAGTVLLLAPYLSFNFLLAGELWPTTLFAKQAEYAALRGLPVWERVGTLLSAPLAGAGAALLPGLLLGVPRWMARRRWAALAGVLWAAGFIALYVWRLPVAYQHGRYLIPVIPVIVVWGLSGMAGIVQPFAARLWPRVLGRVWLGVSGVLLLAFGVLGARAFAWDVAVIESEMVAAAHWLADNTPAASVIAAHDIGALGYFGGRNLVDMAGLVTPEVIPILRDESALAGYLEGRGVQFLVTLRGWYPVLEAGLTEAFVTAGPYSPALGGTNMVVYRWAGPQQ